MLGPGKDDTGLVIVVRARDAVSVLAEPVLKRVGADLDLADSKSGGRHHRAKTVGSRSADGWKRAGKPFGGRQQCLRALPYSVGNIAVLARSDRPRFNPSERSGSPALASSDGHAGMALGFMVRRLTASRLRRMRTH